MRRRQTALRGGHNGLVRWLETRIPVEFQHRGDLAGDGADQDAQRNGRQHVLASHAPAIDAIAEHS